MLLRRLSESVGAYAMPTGYCVQPLDVHSPRRQRLDVKERFSQQRIIGFLRDANAGMRAP